MMNLSLEHVCSCCGRLHKTKKDVLDCCDANYSSVWISECSLCHDRHEISIFSLIEPKALIVENICSSCGLGKDDNEKALTKIRDDYVKVLTKFLKS